MEVTVRAEETSDRRMSVKKSRNGESKDVLAHSGENRCYEERKESENESSHSKTEFSLERKISLKELRNRDGELKDAPDLSSRHGRVSLVLESREKVDKMENTREQEERKNAEGNGKEEPVTLQLSQIKIQQWTKPTVKQNDEEALSRLKQLCSALEGDDIYHYENIDDFDDTTENYQPNCKHFKKSPLQFPPQKHMSCKFKIDENGDGLVTSGVTCKGSPDEQPHETDLRLYFIGEFARKAETIQCLQRFCDNLYDPWDVLEFAGTKQARKWFLNNANDPFDRKHTTELPPITRKHYFREREPRPPPGPVDKKECELLMRWLNGEPKTNKFKLFKLPNTSVFRKPLKAIATSEARAQKLLEYKYVCANCLEGINDEPESGGLRCGHYTCRTCLHHYFKAKMKKKIARMECPHRGCQESFRKRFIINVLDYIPFRVAYSNLCDEKRAEMGLEKSGSTTSSSSSEDNHDPPIISEVPKSSSNESNNCLKSSQDCKKCPGCNTLIRRQEDDESYNIVLCNLCRTKFCWICGKKCIRAFHMYKCPLYGKRKFGKGRIIANVVGYAAGFAIGVPIVGSFVVGTSAVALATLVAVGALSPPVLLTRKIHNYHKLHTSSASKRRLWVLAGASLGVLALPVLSVWGVYKTVATTTRKAEEILHECLLEEDDDYFSHQTLEVDTNALELNRDGQRDATGDKNANDGHIKPQS